MRIELAGGSVKRLISVWRDSNPLPGERSPNRILVQEYGRDIMLKTVANTAIVDTPKWQQFLVDNSPAGDRLLEALKGGPVTPAYSGVDALVIDLDRVKRAR